MSTKGNAAVQPSDLLPVTKVAFGERVRRDFTLNKGLYLLALPVVIYYIMFHYFPMYGAIIAFKEYTPTTGILASPWAANYGMQNFIDFFTSYYFWRTLRNTVVISLNMLIFGFPAPIILALLLNELRGRVFKRTVQTITYMPHFISMVVICGMIRAFIMDTGVVTQFLGLFGFPQINMLNSPELFVPVYVISGIWQEIGWGSIIYLAALTSIDQELYEAASIDGAGRWKQLLKITLPCLIPTIVVLFILRLGRMISVGSEKILLLYNPGIYETADVLNTFTYRKGLLEADYSYSSAVGLFESVVNMLMVVSANWLSAKVSDNSLW